jgi:hypothetical protein
MVGWLRGIENVCGGRNGTKEETSREKLPFRTFRVVAENSGKETKV